MASNTLNVVLIELRDTEANLITKYDASTDAKTLSAGRLAFVTDSDKIGWFKVGDGTTSFADLPYNTVSYNNLTDKPTIGNATLTVKSGGVNVTTFKTNQTSDADINIPLASTTTPGVIPKTETASNSKFLRNDNTWQTVTPANIGAAASSHTHPSSQISDRVKVDSNDTSALPTLNKVNSLITSATSDLNSAIRIKGSIGKTVGTNGATLTTIPTTGQKEGYAYKIVDTKSDGTKHALTTSNSADGIAHTLDPDGDMIVWTADSKWLWIPAGDDVLEVTAGTGLRLSTGSPKIDGGTITSTGTVQLTETFDNSAMTDSGGNTRTKGPTANVAGTNNSTIKVPKITVDKYGRVTALEEFTLTNKDTAHPTYNPESTTSTASPAHGGTFTAIDSLTITNGHVTGINTKTITLPGDQDDDVTQTKLANTDTTTYDVILSNSASGGNTETKGVKKNSRLNFAPKDVTNATIQNSNNKDEGTLVVGSSGSGRIKAKLNTNFLDQASGDVLILNGNI